MTLPGDYTLPVTWITETCRHYRTETQKLTKGESGVLLSGFAADTVMDAMVAGEILSREESVSVQNSSYRLTGVYACREMIAREKEVNLFGSEFDYGRTNSERGSD